MGDFNLETVASMLGLDGLDAKGIKSRIGLGDYSGSAIYLTYPEFQGKLNNAFKVGNVDVGKEVSDATGIKSLPVGHSAVILIDDKGRANYYEYGRYGGGEANVIGHRKSVKGGNYKRKYIATKKTGESDQDFFERIRGRLPYKGTVHASYINGVDTGAANSYWNNKANNKNREEYNLMHTCAGEACNLASDFLHPVNKAVNEVYDFTLRPIQTVVNGVSDLINGVDVGSIGWSLLPGSTGQKRNAVSSRIGVRNKTYN